MSNAVAIQEKAEIQSQQWWNNREQLNIVKSVIISKKFQFSDLEFQYVIEFAKKYELDPFLGQVTAWKDKDDRVVTFVNHAGLLKIAHSSGLFDGMSEVEISKDERGEFGRVEVYRKGCSRPFVAKLYKKEFLLSTYIWQMKPEFMFAKCVEAAGLRKAFPDILSNLYIEEENWIEEPEQTKTQTQSSEKRSPVDEAKKYTDAAEKQKRQEASGMKPVKSVDKMSMNEIQEEIYKAIGFIVLDDLETKILETKCFGGDEILVALREMAKLKKAGMPYLPSDYFGISKSEFADNGVVDDDVPY